MSWPHSFRPGRPMPREQPEASQPHGLSLWLGLCQKSHHERCFFGLWPGL